MTSAESIRERYAIPDWYAPVLEELAAVAPLDPVLPRAARARVHLARLAVPAAQVDAVVDALPAVRDDAAAWWLVSRAYTQLVRRIGAVGFVRPRWPSLAAADDPLAPYLYVAVFLAALPDITRWYAEHDVDEAVLWPTLSDVGTRMAIRTRVTGRRGLDTEQRWLTQHFAAQLFQLGRLQFNLDGWHYAPQLAALAPPGNALGIHIREMGPLDPVACDASFAAARAFFGRHFATDGFRVAVCTSWLLDEQLSEYLPSDSNIVRFRRRFHMLPGAQPGNDDVLRFVFDERDPVADAVPARTTLERAVADHLRAGGEWYVRTGWVEL